MRANALHSCRTPCRACSRGAKEDRACPSSILEYDPPMQRVNIEVSDDTCSLTPNLVRRWSMRSVVREACAACFSTRVLGLECCIQTVGTAGVLLCL